MSALLLLCTNYPVCLHERKELSHLCIQLVPEMLSLCIGKLPSCGLFGCAGSTVRLGQASAVCENNPFF
jgi:hypothetical protein